MFRSKDLLTALYYMAIDNFAIFWRYKQRVPETSKDRVKT